MRFLSLTPLLALSLVSTAFATPSPDVARRAEAPDAAALDVREDKAPASPATDPVVAGDTAAAPITDGGATDPGTTFNGHNVPSLTELSGESIDADISQGYWYTLSSSCQQPT